MSDEIVSELCQIAICLVNLDKNFEKLIESNDKIAEAISGLTTEFYKYRRDLDVNSEKPSNKIWT